MFVGCLLIAWASFVWFDYFTLGVALYLRGCFVLLCFDFIDLELF